MIRSSILLIAIISLIYGSIFLIYPIWFVNFSLAENINVAWLRNIGASVVGLLFFGCLSIYSKFKGKLTLLRIITLTSILQTMALIYSRFYNEFSAEKLLVIDLTIFLAFFVSIYFIFLIVFKSRLFK